MVHEFIDVHRVLEGVEVGQIPKDFLASLFDPQVLQSLIIHSLYSEGLLEMSLLDVLSKLHLARDEVPVIAQVFVDKQVSDSPLHVDVGRLFEEFTEDSCSSDHFEVLPEEVAQRQHKKKNQGVVYTIRVVKQLVLRVVWC